MKLKLKKFFRNICFVNIDFIFSMSSFQKLLNRFLGPFEGSYDPNMNSKDTNNAKLSTFQRGRSFSKVINTRRQRSFEVFKSASCLSCGINKQDQQLPMNNNDKLVSISSKNEYNLEKKSLANHDNENSQQQQQIRQKRRAKTSSHRSSE